MTAQLAARRPVAKKRHNIRGMMRRIRGAIAPFPRAAMFELAEQGFTDPFAQLVACIISIRTLDEVMLRVAPRLFERARTAREMVRLTPAEIDVVIRDCAFHRGKAEQIHEIARRTVDEFGGELPCDPETLLSLRGVGPKCANLVLGIACRHTRIGVDVHVHRVTNRWGYVRTATPTQTMLALEAKLPRGFWVEINQLLVPFGKHICTGRLPKCSTCPVLEYCRQVGVDAHR